MNTKHAPGPWSVAESRNGYDTVIRDANNGPVALSMIAGYGARCGKANSLVIAAAPDLLEFAQEWLDRQGSDENYMTAKARAAIAKATGKQP